MDSSRQPGTAPPLKRPGLTEALVIGSLLVFGLAVLFGWGGIQRKKENLPPPPPVPLPLPAPAEDLSLKVLERFFEGADLEQKLATVRDPDRVRQMMEDYHLKRGHSFPTMGRVSPGKRVTMGERQLVFFEVEPFTGPRYPVAVEWDGFRFAVDWESLTAYGTMEWSEFVEKRPTAAQTMRVYLATAPAALRPPGIAADRPVFRVEHRDSDATALAVASSALAEDLAKRVKGKHVPLTVEIAWNPSAATGGAFVVSRMVAAGWSE